MPTTTIFDGDGTDWTAGVRALGNRTDSAGTAVTDVSADEDRLINGILAEGYLSAGAFQVTDGATGMEVVVGSGVAKADLYVVEGDDPGQHPYIVRLDDAGVTITLDAGDADPRLDQLFLVVADSAYDGGTVTEAQLAYRKGDAAATPSAPGADAAWDAYVLLATVSVAAGASTLAAGDITDNRSPASLLPQLTGAQVGAVEMTARSSAPDGWVLCQGQAISRTDYAALFAAIGTTYGAGDGSTTFNVPDLRGRSPIGAGTLSGNSYALGDKGGSATHTLTSSEMPSHVHAGPSHSHSPGTLSTASDSHSHTANSAGGHTHRRYHHRPDDMGAGNNVNTTPTSSSTSFYSDTSSAGAHTHSTTSDSHSHAVSSGSTAASGSGNTGSTGGGNAHENRHPFLALNFIIFAAA